MENEKQNKKKEYINKYNIRTAQVLGIAAVHTYCTRQSDRTFRNNF